jgi:DHA1 family bicyclomycin/chloramphenicol resistance-like MFS transporter
MTSTSTPHDRVRLVVLAAMTAFPPMAIDQYLPAWPTMATSLHASPFWIQWTLSAFFIAFASGQLLLGPLSDRFGRRPVLFLGIAIFIVASIGCACSTSIEALVAWRALQGFGAAGAPVVARAMVRDLHDGKSAARMLSLMALVMGAAPLLAPILGGRVTLAWGWAANFWVLAGFGVVCALAGLFALPETLPPQRRRSASPRAIVASYRALLGNARFRGYTASAGISFAGYFAYISGSPFVFIELFHVPADVYGYLFGGNVLGMMALSTLNSRMVGNAGIDVMLQRGLVLAACAGVALLAVGISGAGGLVALYAALFVFIGAQGWISANAMAGALSVRPDLAGAAAGLAGTTQFLVGAVAGNVVTATADGTQRPMALVIAAASLLALVVARVVLGAPATTASASASASASARR